MSSPRLCWFVGEKYLRDLKAREELSPRLLASLESLADFLVSQVRIMERGTEAAKRDAKENVPSDRVKDAAAVARELRWRVKQAAGHWSDDESAPIRETAGPTTNSLNGKRKRESSHTPTDQVQFRNFKIKSQLWDHVVQRDRSTEEKTVSIQKPNGNADSAEPWMEWQEEPMSDCGEQGKVRQQRDVVMKYRATTSGLERERVERVVEFWTWEEEQVPLGGSPRKTDVNDARMDDSGD